MYRPITILMWKHLVVRKRRFILTAFELVVPIAVFLILFFFKDGLTDPHVSNNSTNSSAGGTRSLIYQQRPILLENTRGPIVLVYTPQTNFTGQLMDKVADELGLRRLESFPHIYIDGEIYDYYGSDFASSEQLINHMMGSEASVIFQDTTPNRLNYVLATNNNLNAKLNMFLNSTTTANFLRDPGDPLLRLQWAIDKNFLEMVSGDPINQKVLVQALPEPTSSVDSQISAMVMFLPTASYCGLFLPFILLMTRLVEERLLGVQEMLKMAGISSSTLATSHFLNVLPSGLVYCIIGTVLMKASDTPLLPKTNAFFIGFMLILHFISIMLAAFLFSFIVKRSQYEYLTSISFFAYILLFMLMRLTWEVKEYPHKILLLLTGIVPHVPVGWFWKECIALEFQGRESDFSTWTKSHTKETGSVLECYLMTIVQIVGFSVLIWYLSLVTPGPYGVAERPWNFCCKKKVQPKALDVTEDVDQQARPNPQYFEEPPGGKQVGIRVLQVSKMFEMNCVLNNVTFDVYHGEITVLLGHNGAGKTTLMSIITGTMCATSGKVYVKGMDVSTEQHNVRQHLGVCPQHNLFISHFSIIEHVIFFSLLKGSNFKEARAAGHDLLKELGIDDKAEAVSSQLSGGMKRRLQLACALAGGSSVLILDEPTSGLDVETRRELWDLLLSLRGNRTVLLTTHFMEEADALGDRVAALHSGVLQCHATPMHLKKHIGAGYNLTFNTIDAPREPDITAVVKSMVPDATLRQQTKNSLVYDVPAGNNRKFPEIFRMLEAKKAELGIESMAIGMPTMEEVFLRLCSDFTSVSDDDGDVQEPTYTRLTGCALHAIQIKALVVRHLRFICFSKYAFALLQVILPILFIFLLSRLLNEPMEPTSAQEKIVPLDFNSYDENPDQKVFYKVNDTPSLKAATDEYQRVKFVDTNGENVTNAALRAMSENHGKYSQYVAGIELDDNSAKVLYNPYAAHARPAALNLLSNLLATRRSLVSGRVITASRRQAAYTDTDNTGQMSTAIMFNAVIFLSTIINIVSLCCREHASGTRHIIMMAGCHPSVFWLTRILFYTVLFFIVLVVPIIIATAVFETNETLNQPESLASLTLLFVLATLAWLAFICFLSFLGSQTFVSIILSVIVILSLATAIWRTTYVLSDTKMKITTYIPLTVAGVLLPPDTLFAALQKASHSARITAQDDICDQRRLLADGLDKDTRCGTGIEPASFYAFNKTSPGPDMLLLLAQFIVYTALTILAERGVFTRCYERVRCTFRYQPPPLKYNNQIVNHETAYVNSVIKNPTQQNDALLVHNVHKIFKTLFKPVVNSLKGINFSVKQGECFGLLGVNGAGKSTTFKIIVADEPPTRGQLYSDGHIMQKERVSYLRSLAYCPQFFGLDAFLTGSQNLTLLLTLRGLQSDDVSTEVHAWIKVVGLEKYKHRIVEKYSGGCQRRMATAAALSVGCPLTLLDEPTSGVDVAARRRVWSAMRRGLRQKRAIVITSHSMDEMESLCDRIAIMSAGEICAIGSPAALRDAFAAGYAVTFKITGGDTAQKITELKSYMKDKFDCALKDEHKTMLRYHINDTMPYSELFTKLEGVLTSHPGLIEDYTVTSTTLEEVFLSFAQDDEASAAAATQTSPNATASHGTMVRPTHTTQISQTGRP